MTLTDDELQDIRERERKRQASIKPGLKNRRHPEFLALRETLNRYLHRSNINNGNVYADELADFLLSNCNMTVT